MMLAAFIGGPSPAIAQNFVTNGRFDTNATGWTAANDSLGGWTCCKGNPGGWFWLDANPSPTTDPTVSQVVNGLTPGVRYAVSGDFERLIDRGGGSPTGLSFGVAIDGVFYYQAPQSDWAWHSFSFSFVAASSSATLSLSAQMNGTGVSYGIDNLVVQPLPVFAFSLAQTNLVFSWPTSTIGFNLQSASDLTAASWSNVTNPPVVVGTNYSVTASATGQIQFFRLKK